ncbi:hypothetical protein C8R45DRAFT_170486 [Mycena sanguinolenta]|nr:hypothetical protein C8R45DRAFT_170486 [Mycena sanguinolenta]
MSGCERLVHLATICVQPLSADGVLDVEVPLHARYGRASERVFDEFVPAHTTALARSVFFFFLYLPCSCICWSVSSVPVDVSTVAVAGQYNNFAVHAVRIRGGIR